MFSKIMSNTNILFMNMRKSTKIKRSRTYFNLNNKVIIRGARDTLPNLSNSIW